MTNIFYGVQFLVSAYVGILTYKQNLFSELSTFKYLLLFAIILVITESVINHYRI